MNDNSPKPKFDPSLAEREKKLFAEFPMATESDLKAIGVESKNDVVFSLRPNVLQGDSSQTPKTDKAER